MPESKDTLLNKARAAVFGSFVGDSLALGVHWIYDTEEIVRDYGRVTNLIDPSPGNQKYSQELFTGQELERIRFLVRRSCGSLQDRTSPLEVFQRS